jgi:hypothetical protein
VHSPDRTSTCFLAICVPTNRPRRFEPGPDMIKMLLNELFRSLVLLLLRFKRPSLLQLGLSLLKLLLLFGRQFTFVEPKSAAEQQRELESSNFKGHFLAAAYLAVTSRTSGKSYENKSSEASEVKQLRRLKGTSIDQKHTER